MKAPAAGRAAARRTSSRRSRRAIGVSALALVALAAWGSGLLRGPAPEPPPLPDLRGLEAPVTEALTAARAAVVAAPRSVEAWRRLAMCLDAHDLTEAAAAAYGVLGRLDGKDYRWPYLESLCLPEEAPVALLGRLRRARDLAPDLAPIHLRLGVQELSAGDVEAAGRSFARALEIEPGHSHALLGLARIAETRGDRAGAIAGLEAAARRRPGHREVHVALARLYSETGKDHLAERARHRAESGTGTTPIPDPVRSEVATLGRGSVRLSARAGEALAAGRPDVAAGLLAEALRLRPGDVGLRLDLVRARLAEGRLDEAAVDLDGIVGDAPRNIPARRMQALVLWRRGDAIAAEAAALAVLRDVPSDAGMRILRARLHLAAGRVAAAITILRDVLRDRPFDTEAAGLLVWILATDPSDEIRDATTALRIAGQLCDDYLEPEPRVRLGLAVAYGAAGRFPEAVAALETARSAAEATGQRAFLDETEPILAALRAGRPWRTGP